MQAYLELLRQVYEHGDDKGDRTGTGTRSLFGRQLLFNLGDGFPLLTTKKIHTKSLIHELLWFIRGESNVRSLQEAGVTIWDEWADSQGNLGPVYGHQWRHWGQRETYVYEGEDGNGPPTMRLSQGWDQLAAVIDEIKTKPDSRRMIVSAWNVSEIDKMALPPCHLLYQFNATKDRLSLQMYQRSADLFLGVPFNIGSYALLLSMVAAQTGYKPHELIICLGDVHIYNNHFEQVEEQLTRKPGNLPKLVLNPDVKSLFDYRFEDITIEDYHPQAHIKAPIAV